MRSTICVRESAMPALRARNSSSRNSVAPNRHRLALVGYAASTRRRLAVPRLRRRRAPALGTAKDRADARDQLLLHERLDKVVVGAAVQAGDAIFDCVARREHQNGRLHALAARALRAREKPSMSGQTHVDDGNVIGSANEMIEAGLAVGHDVRRKLSAPRACAGSILRRRRCLLRLIFA